MKHLAPNKALAIRAAQGACVLTALIALSGCNSPTSFKSIPFDQTGLSAPTNPGNPGGGDKTPDGPSSPDDTLTPPSTEVPGFKTSDTFVQQDSPNKVDILIINDNSESMASEQKRMGDRFDSFISALSDIDYQIAMTTTDIESPKHGQFGRIMNWNGTNAKILTSQTPNAAAVFKSTIQRKEAIGCGGDCPSTNEQPLGAMIKSFDERFKGNNGFFRDGADLAIVVLSDEDEMSAGGVMATKPNDVVRAFTAAFGSEKKLAVYGIVIIPGDKACLSIQGQEAPPYYGVHVAELAALTGGSVGSICDTDYGKNLTSISQRVRQLIGTFELRQLPKDGSVKVTLTPAANIAWKVEGKKVIFDSPPPAGTKIEVSYTF